MNGYNCHKTLLLVPQSHKLKKSAPTSTKRIVNIRLSNACLKTLIYLCNSAPVPPHRFCKPFPRVDKTHSASNIENICTFTKFISFVP